MENIIFAVLVLGAIAIVFGLILSVAAKVFEVKVDERLPKIQECLAGANCGGCGYPGCAGCAEAILAGKAPVTACAPAGAEGAAKIAAIMGMEAPSGEKMVAHVICNGGDAAVKNFEYVGIADCVGALKVAGGPTACSFGCLGFGSCVAACQFDALHINDKGVAEVDKALARLGAPSDSDCEIKFCLNQGEDDAWEERIEGIIRSEGLYEANKMLRSLDTGDMDWGKLTAAVELTDVKSAANIAAVAEHLGEFAFIPDAKSESDVGHFLVDNVEEYEMNIEMEEYFDFSGFGEYFAEEHDGQFVSGGFVYFDSDRTLDEFLEELESEDEGMDMGGM